DPGTRWLGGSLALPTGFVLPPGCRDLGRSLVNLRLPDFVELPMNRRQAGIDSLVVGRISRVANANQKSLGRKQPAAAAAIDRLAGSGVVRFALVLVDCSNLSRPHAR